MIELGYTKKNILVTGATGFLGRHLMSEFNSESQYRLYTIGRSSKGLDKDFHTVCDLSQEVPKISRFDYNMVIHMAGKAHVFPKTQEEIDDFFKVNYEGTENLLKGLDRAKCHIDEFVFISTVAVYGLNEGLDLDETTLTNPITPYGHSKLKAENLILNWAMDNNVKPIILRLPLIVGHNPTGNLGDMSRAIAKGRYIRLKNNCAQKSMVLAGDVIRLFRNDLKTGIYHLTDGVNPRFCDVEKAFESRYKRRIVISLPLSFLKIIGYVGDMLERIYDRNMPLSSLRLKKINSSLTFSDTKARMLLNWRPQKVLPFIQERINKFH